MSKLLTFEATVVHETEVVEVYEDGTVTMPESMAIEKGLI